MKYLKLKYILILLALFISNLSYSSDQLDIKNLVINDSPIKYTDVTFKNIQNKQVFVENLKGQLVILNFWAIWCKPCREEMKSLDLLQSNKELKNIKIFPINVGNDNVKKSKDFFKELDIKFLDIYFDEKLSLTKKFSLRGIPTTIILNKKGEEFARIIGAIDFNDQVFIDWIKKYD